VSRLLRKLRTIAKLGIPSLLRVGIYRVGLGIGLHPVFRVRAVSAAGPLFGTNTIDMRTAPAPATPAWREEHWAFGRPIGRSVSDMPEWHRVARTGYCWPGVEQCWNAVPTFAPNIGDIKEIWETSRFDWIVAFAQHAREGDTTALDRINLWVSDWTQKNPSYRGPNWMCGQEASLRLGHVAVAALILDAIARPTPALTAFILNHLRRIAPTVSYALGQDNNHATSEAMGLFVGGAWLASYSSDVAICTEGEAHCRRGRKLLEKSVDRLIFDDGGFAQYSVVYHRLMLDTLSMAELWRQRVGLPRFKINFYDRAARASGWLAQLIIDKTGDTPNLGSNDGAWFLPIGLGGYRDFRPSAALASTLFEGGTRFGTCQSAKALLDWLEIVPTSATAAVEKTFALLPDSGILRIVNNKYRLFMRLPGTRFRPPQADALHLDLWHGDRPIAVDGGTYSYAVPAPGCDVAYFASSAAHNTVLFDNCDHMPRVGRFLFADWLQRGNASVDARKMVADLTDYRGNHVARTVTINGDTIEVTDVLTGAFSKAVLHWHLGSGDWAFASDTACCDRLTVMITCDQTLTVAPVHTPRSTFYLDCVNGFTLRASVCKPCTIRSKFTFPAAMPKDLTP
jgi:Heparinase II/III-like protein